MSGRTAVDLISVVGSLSDACRFLDVVISVEESGRYPSIVTLVNFVEETAEEANDPVGVSESREREFSPRGRFGEQQQLQALGNQQNQSQQREESF